MATNVEKGGTASPVEATVDESVAKHTVVAEAQAAADTEHRMTVWQAVTTYRHAIGWSVLLSSTLIMEGYDLALLGTLFASPPFNRKYGKYDAKHDKYQISASWQSGLSNGVRAGQVCGLIIAGWTVDRFGYKHTTLGFLTAMIAFVFILFFAPNIHTLLAGEILCGMPWGAFQGITPAYASEVAPLALRPFLATFINMCWVIGQFFAVAVNKGSSTRDDQWAYRIPFAVQWVWPVPILCALIFAPESPWWYIRKNNYKAARRALTRLTARQDQDDFDVDKALALIEHTNRMEEKIKAGVSYKDCFRGTDRRRSEAVIAICVIQTLCGPNLMYYFSYFLVQAGMNPSNSFSLSLVQNALGMIGTATSWFLMTKVGRRKIHFSGLLIQFILLFIIGCLSLSKTSASLWAIGVLLIVFTFVYDCTIGPVTYCLISELSSTRLKAKTIVLACAAYNASSVVVNIITNYQLSSTAWNWQARSAFFWAGSCLLCLVWVYFRLPEPKDRTYAELDIMFEHGIPARKFATTNVKDLTGQSEPVVEEK